MSYITDCSECPRLDYKTGSIMYSNISRSSHDSTEMLQPTFIGPDILLMLLRKKTRSSKGIQPELQMELALLWRTLGILRYSVGIPGVLQSFYEDLLDTIMNVDSLSLSNFSSLNVSINSYQYSRNGENTLSKHEVSAQLSSGQLNSSSKKSYPDFLFPVPELAYLKDGNDFEGDEINDPVGIVQKLFNLAEGFAVTVPFAERCAMHSVCLALAVKSGRLSLLLQTAQLLISGDNETNTEAEEAELNLQILQDVSEYLEDGMKNKIRIIASAEKAKYHSNHPYRNKSKQSWRLLSRYIRNGRLLCSHNEMSTGTTLSFGKADHGKLGLGDSQVGNLHFKTIFQNNLDIRV